MAYMNQEHKKELAPAIMKICRKYGVKATLAVRHHSTLILNVRESNIDFLADWNRGAKERHERKYGGIIDWDTWKPIKGYITVNTYHIEDSWTGKAKDFLTEAHNAMNVGNFDKSDVMTDYFHVGWYTEINIGKWNKPYVCTALETA